MTESNADTLSLRVAGSGTKRPKYGCKEPAAPQCLLRLSAIVHNLHNINLHFVMIDYSRKTEGEKKNVGQAEKKSF